MLITGHRWLDLIRMHGDSSKARNKYPIVFAFVWYSPPIHSRTSKQVLPFLALHGRLFLGNINLRRMRCVTCALRHTFGIERCLLPIATGRVLRFTKERIALTRVQPTGGAADRSRNSVRRLLQRRGCTSQNKLALTNWSDRR